MGSYDAGMIRGAVIFGWRGDMRARACGKLTGVGVLAFGEPLIPVPVRPERPCRDSDALIAVLGAVRGEVASHPSRGALSSSSVTDRYHEPW